MRKELLTKKAQNFFLQKKYWGANSSKFLLVHADWWILITKFIHLFHIISRVINVFLMGLTTITLILKCWYSHVEGRKKGLCWSFQQKIFSFLQSLRSFKKLLFIIAKASFWIINLILKKKVPEWVFCNSLSHPLLC